MVMAFNAIFNNISVLLVMETGVSAKKTTDLLLVTDKLYLYSGFGPCRFWVLKCWRMPKAHDC
jgi:hypothetical protein